MLASVWFGLTFLFFDPFGGILQQVRKRGYRSFRIRIECDRGAAE